MVKNKRARQQDIFCHTIATQVGQRDCEFTVNLKNLLVCKAHMGDEIAILLPLLVWHRILTMSHYSPLAGHSGRRQMYETLRQTFCLLHMATNVDCIVQNCRRCVRNNRRYRRKHNLHHFPASRPLEFFPMDIAGPFFKTVQSCQYILVITDCYCELARAVPTSKATVTQVVNVYVDHWLVPYGIPPFPLTDNESQFISKFF